jgi:DNA invertase Pin-like site-specific DNA recombinase
LGGVAQFEREIISERQREDVAKAKTAGKYKGREATGQNATPLNPLVNFQSAPTPLSSKFNAILSKKINNFEIQSRNAICLY